MTKKTLVAGLLALSVILTGCGGGTPTATPEAEEELVPIVSITGKIVPAAWAALSAQAGGQVLEVLVEPGDAVAAGDVLVRLDPTDAQLAVQQAEAALAAAQAQLALLKAGPRPEEEAAAEALVSAAQAAVSQAAAQRDQLAAGAIEAEVAAAQAGVTAAEVARKAAEDRYDQIEGKVHGWIEEETILQLRAAEQALAAARAQLAQVQGGAGARSRAANAAVSAAVAQQDLAQSQLDLLVAGATTEQVAAAQATIAQAQAGLETASVALGRCEVRAPFAGTAGAVSVRAGELITPGEPLVTLGDLATLRVETTDLDEVDVARVALGQRASVTFDAIPERVFAGQVVRISPMAEPGAGGVNYTVVVTLDESDPAIRWGMTAFVDIEVGK